MYVVTFYSFKGGVGRTMALANVAASLARAGRRVLAVDFDLEAPGLASYAWFNEAPTGPGLVEYVSRYRETGNVPEAADHIAVCDRDGHRLWFMRAGDQTRPDYSARLNAIDWEELYGRQDGFLLFEDLKRQWAGFEGVGFDYVLIDSRTGHTDVSGICTRQLPDAVVAVFMPTRQNLDGLVPIVKTISAERDGRRQIKLHFCPANVPDLDDEEEILDKRLRDASERLAYAPGAAITIHNHQSLELLEQPVFALSRPNTKLSRQYEELRSAIIAENVDDAEGVCIALDRMLDEVRRARSMPDVNQNRRYVARVQAMRARHPGDGHVAFQAATVLQSLGEQAAQLDALETAIAAGVEESAARLRRATLTAATNKAAAVDDLRAVLASVDAAIFDVGPAAQLLGLLGGLDEATVRSALSRPDDQADTIATIGNVLLSFRETFSALSTRMLELHRSDRLDERRRTHAANLATLALIGDGRFAEAKRHIAPDGRLPDNGPAHLLFNYAMAEWGESKSPPAHLLEWFLGRHEGAPPAEAEQWEAANSQQCLALATAVLGRDETARRHLDAARDAAAYEGFVFSCWRYRARSLGEFRDDLEALRNELATKSITPPFTRESPMEQGAFEG